MSAGEEVVDLWAMAAELERQFAGYKQRLAERDGAAAREHDDDAAAACDDDTGGDVCADDAEAPEAGGRSSTSSGGGDVRGRMYEAYVRRRDERLREGWRARMERKEAEVKALWAQLELTGRTGQGAERVPSSGGDPTAATMVDDGVAAGDERKPDRNDDDKRRSSDTALAPRRITGKKHARTRSFSSSITTTTGRNRSDAGRRRALSQEPPPSQPQASAEARKDNRGRPAGGAATTTATARPKTSLRRKNSVKGHGPARPAGPKLPRSLPRRSRSGGLEPLSGEVVLTNDEASAPGQSSSSECAAHGETPKASPPRSFVVKDDSGGAPCEANARVASPESDPGEVVQAVPDGEPAAKNAHVEERGEEKVDASPDHKVGKPNGEITSDSETEPSYVYINKDVIEEQAMAVSEPLKLAELDAALDSGAKANVENSQEMPAPVDATPAEIATTNAEEAPARESSDESSFSVRSGMSARPSCSSREQSIERLLEADAVLLQKKREERAEKSTPKTPGSAGSRVSGAARSPRDTVRGFKKFLSFGKKNKGREVTVIDCTSPSVPSLADDDSASGVWQPVGSIKPRMGFSDAASDDTEHGYQASPRVSVACSLQSLVAASPAKSELAEIVPQEKSPKAHRSFFSFRSLNCGRADSRR